MFLEKNNDIRAELFRLVDGLTDEQFNHKPTTKEWSPKEILDHLTRMEKTITNGIEQQLANPESPKAKRKPIQVSTWRAIKVKAPSHTVPTGEYRTKEEMKVGLHEARMKLLSAYQNADYETLQNKSLKHPVFGQVPLIQWFPFVGLHEKRHVKQLEKTIEKIKGHK